jgi:hypothetical protein
MGYDRNDRFPRGGRDRYESDDRYGARSSYGGGDRDRGGYGQERYRGYGERERGYGETYGAGRDYRDRGDYGRDQFRSDRDRGYGRAPADYDYDDRGFLSRAGDEVRSWLGDEDAERRREADARYDQRYYERQVGSGGGRHDPSYGHWRDRQIAALDRDYDEYRRENQTRFDSEFGTYRQRRSDQRSSLGKVAEHMEVVGSDGGHVGTVDKVRGDRIILTKTDSDAHGHHHSIPSSWIESVDDRIVISRTADQAQSAWRDEERRGALFGDDDRQGSASYSYYRFTGLY